MAESDATQCGFCTPGFVMSAYAFAAGGEKADLDTIHDALAGNLCRCTGYRPIVEAMTKVAGAARRARAAAAERARRRRASAAASMRRARSPSFWPCAPGIPRRCCWPAPPISACWPAGPASRRPPSSMSRTCPSSRLSRETEKEIDDRRRRKLCAGHAGADRQLSGAENLSRAAGLAADPHHGHAGRQYRHGLADRRHAAGADRARGEAQARLDPRRARAAAGGFLPRLSQDRVGRRRGDREHHAPETLAGRSVLLRQAFQAPRPGHLDRRGGLSPADQVRPRSKTARIAFGGMAATPKRATAVEAALRKDGFAAASAARRKPSSSRSTTGAAARPIACRPPRTCCAASNCASPRPANAVEVEAL